MIVVLVSMSNKDKYGARLRTKRATMNALFDRPEGASYDEIEQAMMASPHQLPLRLAKREFKLHSDWMRSEGWIVEGLPNGNIRFQCQRRLSTNKHTQHSAHRERLVEHLVVGEILKELWRRDIFDVEVLRPEVDNGGYDIVFEHRGVTRHVQLKSSFRGSKTARQNIGIALMEKPAGCVIWVQFDADTMDLGPFLWFGCGPKERLPDIAGFKVTKHTKANSRGVKAERPALRTVPKREFTSLATIGDVVDRLFGGE